MKMNDDVRRWIDELRFGGHVQTRAGAEAVQFPDGTTSYCALGVGYLTMGLEFRFSAGHPNFVNGHFGFAYDGWLDVDERFGLTYRDRAIIIGLNDNNDHPFSLESIADVIEYAAKQECSIDEAANQVLGVEL